MDPSEKMLVKILYFVTDSLEFLVPGFSVVLGNPAIKMFDPPDSGETFSSAGFIG